MGLGLICLIIGSRCRCRR